MARKRCLDTDLGRFLIAHLTDHNHVRIGAQERAHRRRKIKAGLIVHLHLTQTLLRNLDGVFGGPNLGLDGIDMFQHRVQRRGFTGTGRAATKK